MLPCLDFALDNYKYHYVKSLSNSFLDGDNCRHKYDDFRPSHYPSNKFCILKGLLHYCVGTLYLDLITVLTAVSFDFRLARLTTVFEIPSNFRDGCSM